MQALPLVATIERGDIQPQLDGFFGSGGLPTDQFAHVQMLAMQLRDHGNSAFLRGVPEGPLTSVPILLDDEKLEGLIEQIPRQEGPRPTIIAAGNVSQAGADEQRRALNVAGLRKLGELCASVDMPFSYYDTAYLALTPIGRVKADGCNAGTLEYLWRMRELRQPPKDRLILSCDADLVAMDPKYMANMQTDFEQSTTPAWIGTPSVYHELLEGRFDRINYLIKWYDEYLAGGRTPTHFGFNMGAYAAVGGLNVNSDFGEAETFYRALVAHFGKNNITEAFLENPVVVSSRSLVDRIVKDREDVEYEAVRVPATNVGESYRRSTPMQDISPERMREVLHILTAKIYLYKESMRLRRLGEDPALATEETRKQVGLYAASKVLAVHDELGVLEDSERAVKEMLLVVLRRSIEAAKTAGLEGV